MTTKARTWYHLQRDEWSIHFTINKGATLFTGDGGDPRQVAKAKDGEWIYLFHPEILKTNGLTNKDWPQPRCLPLGTFGQYVEA